MSNILDKNTIQKLLHLNEIKMIKYRYKSKKKLIINFCRIFS